MAGLGISGGLDTARWEHKVIGSRVAGLEDQSWRTAFGRGGPTAQGCRACDIRVPEWRKRSQY